MTGLWNPLLMATPTGGGSFGKDIGILVIQACDVEVDPGLVAITVIQDCAVSTAFDINQETIVSQACVVTTDFDISQETIVAQACAVTTDFDISQEIPVNDACAVTTLFDISTEIIVGQDCKVVVT